MRSASDALDASARPVGTADLERRTVTALVYAVVVLAALFAPAPIFAVLVAILAALAYIELRSLFRYRSYRPWLVGLLFTLAFVAAHVFAQTLVPLTTTVLVIVVAFGVVTIAVLMRQAARGRTMPGILAAVFTLAGSAYVGLGFGFLIELWLADGAATRGWLGDLPVWLLLALVPTWVGDSVAYLVGSRIGRRKIVPSISPGKTWEGTLAGFGAAAVIALLIAVSAGLRTGPSLLVAVLVGPVGFAGDLFESAIKRVAGAKDSGTLFPGHGGVLDRIDSLIFVAPAVALVLALARQ
jgi:phosphatidate cytidylyltransferase